MTERDTESPRSAIVPTPEVMHDKALRPPSIAGESVINEMPDPPLRSDAPSIIGSVQPESMGVGHDGPPVSGAGSVGAGSKTRLGDRIMFLAASGAGAFTIVLVGLVGIFLVVKAIPGIRDDGSNFFTTHDWNTTVTPGNYGVAGLLYVTVIISLIAMIIAFPISLGIALFITQYAPTRIAKPVAYVVDLLAAIPSVIYGIWGLTELSPKLVGVQKALYHLGGVPLFKQQPGYDQGTIFDGGVVLAIMILPIMTAIARDVFDRTPRHNVEAAWALGATRWEMIRLAVLPYGRSGIVSGAMLGLGRALGETIAILIVVGGLSSGASFHISIFNGGSTFASRIAADTAEFGNNPGPYIAAGLVLFVLTFIVNAAARAVVNRRKEFS